MKSKTSTFAELTNAPFSAIYIQNPFTIVLALHSKDGDNIGRASDVSSKYVAVIHCTTASHSLGHHCLVSLLFMASLYSTLSKNSYGLLEALDIHICPVTC